MCWDFCCRDSMSHSLLQLGPRASLISRHPAGEGSAEFPAFGNSAAFFEEEAQSLKGKLCATLWLWTFDPMSGPQAHVTLSSSKANRNGESRDCGRLRGNCQPHEDRSGRSQVAIQGRGLRPSEAFH